MINKPFDSDNLPGRRKLPVLSWLVTGLLVVVIMSILIWQPKVAAAMAMHNIVNPTQQSAESLEETRLDALTFMPEFDVLKRSGDIQRVGDLHTAISVDKSRTEAVTYEVQSGDSLFGIAAAFNISPETILWANYEILYDNPHFLAVGQQLLIPPISGIYYQWQNGDSLDTIAAQFRAEPESILMYHGNQLDVINPQIQPGQFIMIPDGWRAINSWVVTVSQNPDGGDGVDDVLGVCKVTATVTGTGGFIWPSFNHVLSGNDFWSGHLAIDIAIGMGDPVWAADGGNVIYAGSYPYYGNIILVDHGNGYQTLYAHLSEIAVSCGVGVHQGQVIGYGGSTGNSTGPHLHFEIRYLNDFVNPHFYLP